MRFCWNLCRYLLLIFSCEYCVTSRLICRLLSMAARVGKWHTWFLYGCSQFKISRMVYVPTYVRRTFSLGVNREGVCQSGKCRNTQVQTYIAVVKHWLSFLVVTCFPRVGGVTTLSACVSSFWIWAGLHSNARGGAERNAHRFPSSWLALLAASDYCPTG